MLQTAIHEIETSNELEKIINENENVMVCAGRMGPMCIPVYEVMEELESERTNIKFFSMAFDTPEAAPIRNAPMCRNFMGLPFTVYYKNGQMVHATSSIQSHQQITNILDKYFE
ncbi:MAG: thioredoxin family protein [Bacteroidales bacterium]|nr:thioredoxin family protein [Bacteroidales bacterium]